MSRLLMIAGVGVWLIAPWFFSYNPAEPTLFRYGLCLLRDGDSCLRSIWWLDFSLLGAGLMGLGWWLKRRQAKPEA
ncbi:MAG: hypothetical protein KA754_01140 [Corallincola sp.]|nr:hypothetical protein [Corallincola sp.]